jgi:hypothetical protein
MIDRVIAEIGHSDARSVSGSFFALRSLHGFDVDVGKLSRRDPSVVERIDVDRGSPSSLRYHEEGPDDGQRGGPGETV